MAIFNLNVQSFQYQLSLVILAAQQQLYRLL